MRKLEQTRDFIELYQYHVGKSEVPPQFFLWSCLSLIAACVSDRVWIERDAASQIYPNLYVFLIGPSGSGKEKAVTTAAKYTLGVDGIRLYNGMATKQALIDYLAAGGQKINGVTYVQDQKLYFVTEELANSLNTPALAQETVKLMTALFVRSTVPITEGTRTSGFIQVADSCINWLAGTTDDWMVECIPKSAIEGGLFARLLAVRGRRNYSIRYPEIIQPFDYDEVKAHLQERVTGYANMGGYFIMDDEARDYHNTWYRSRPAPDDVLLEPTFNRSDEMILRIACLLAMSAWDCTTSEYPHDRVTLVHLKRAIALYDTVVCEMPQVMKLTRQNPRVNHVEVVLDIVTRKGPVDRSTLLKRVGHKGMDREDMDRALLTLMQQSEVESFHYKDSKATWYGMVGRA